VDDVSSDFQSTRTINRLTSTSGGMELNKPISLAALGTFLFWTSKESAYLYWTDVHSGQSKMTKLKLGNIHV